MRFILVLGHGLVSRFLKVCRVNVHSVSKCPPPPFVFHVKKSSCARADSITDYNTIGPGSKPCGDGILYIKFLTDYHHNTIILLTVCWCVESRKGYPDLACRCLNTLKYVVVYSSVIFHISG